MWVTFGLGRRFMFREMKTLYQERYRSLKSIKLSQDQKTTNFNDVVRVSVCVSHPSESLTNTTLALNNTIEV